MSEIFSSQFPKPLSILVLHGGTSAERDISLESGQNVSSALELAGHKITTWDTCQILPSAYWLQQFDCIFIALHGGDGEDGTVQSLLEKAGTPFTGCGSESAALTMNKWLTKVRLNEHDLPVPFGVLFFDTVQPKEILEEVKQLVFPLIVKPNQQGSSLGVTMIHKPEDLQAALDSAFEFDREVLVEQAKSGAEWTVAVLDRIAFPAIRISYSSEIFDYHAKYESNATQYLFADQHEKDLAGKLETLAVEACQALGTRGVVRVDFRLDLKNRPFILEINSVPGMTSHSLVPKAAGKVGWTMTELCEELIGRAIKHKQEQFPFSASA